MRKNKRKPLYKAGRDWLAVSAHFATGAGPHKDKRLKRKRTRKIRDREAICESLG